jgi:hypothetical protein
MPDRWPEALLIDHDSHVTEPLDLWSTCLLEKWGAEAPRVAWNEASRKYTWHRQAVDTYLTRTWR